MNDRASIEREIEDGIHKMQRDLGISEKPYFPGERIAGYVGFAALIAMSIAVSFYATKAKAQPTSAQIFAPMEVFCSGSQKHIVNVLSKTGMFRDAFALSGEGARQVSKNIFNHTPPADHIIIIRQTNSGSIMVPCVLGKNGPEWAGEQSNRVEIDFVFKRDLDNPKTEVSEQPIKSRRAKK